MSVNDEHQDLPSNVPDMLRWLADQEIKGLVIGFSLENGMTGGVATGTKIADIMLAVRLAKRYGDIAFEEFMTGGDNPEEQLAKPEFSGPVN